MNKQIKLSEEETYQILEKGYVVKDGYEIQLNIYGRATWNDDNEIEEETAEEVSIREESEYQDNTKEPILSVMGERSEEEKRESDMSDLSEEQKKEMEEMSIHQKAEQYLKDMEDAQSIEAEEFNKLTPPIQDRIIESQEEESEQDYYTNMGGNI